MNPSVYVETTVVSYLTARPHRDIVVAAHQQLTREWWDGAPQRFELFASQLVINEASRGDPIAAQERLAVLAQLPVLETGQDAEELAKRLVAEGAVPASVFDDALHLAIAATHGIGYLVTWNCRHLANAQVFRKIESICRSAGWSPPVLCTPDLLMETKDVD